MGNGRTAREAGMKRIQLGMSAAAMTLVLVAAACGGDNKPSTSSGTDAASGAGSARDRGGVRHRRRAPAVSLPGTVNDHGSKTVKDGDEIETEMDDFYFAPTFMTGPAGAKVKLDLANEGEKSHTFTIDSAKIDQQIDPGAKATVEVTLPASGTLAFYCRFHVSGGMQEPSRSGDVAPTYAGRRAHGGSAQGDQDGRAPGRAHALMASVNWSAAAWLSSWRPSAGATPPSLTPTTPPPA